MSLQLPYDPLHMKRIRVLSAGSAIPDSAESGQERLHQHYRMLKISAAAAGLLFMGAGCFIGALPAFLAWSAGYVFTSQALRMHQEKRGMRRTMIPGSRIRDIRDQVRKVWSTAGLQEPDVYVLPGHGAMRSIRTLSGRMRLLVPVEIAGLPQQQFHALLYREAVRLRHHDPIVLGSVRAMKGAVNAGRRYLMWMPVWVAGGGEWGFNVLGMVHAAVGVAASPLYLGVLAGGIGMRCTQSVLGRYQELRADRDAAAHIHQTMGRREVLAQAILEAAEREQRAFSVRCTELGVQLAHRPILGRVWTACAPRLVEIHRSFVEGRTRLLRMLAWGMRDSPPLRTRVKHLEPEIPGPAAQSKVELSNGLAQREKECTRVPSRQPYRPQTAREGQFSRNAMQYRKPVPRQSPGIGLE